MPDQEQIQRAELYEIRWLDDREEPELVDQNPIVRVQFNPQTLKVAYSNQKAGGDQPEGSAVQYVGSGTTKLSVDLLFDVTIPQTGPNAEQVDDVRKLTQKVFTLMKPKPADEPDKFVPPGVRFIWGSFLFDGVMDSMNETLEFFSSDGRPLRARVSISLSQQELKFRFNERSNGTPGTQPQAEARQSDSIQQMAARAGKAKDWKAIAEANDIENPRNLTAGLRVNLTAPSASVSAGAGPVSATAGVGGAQASVRTPTVSVRGPGIQTGGFGGVGGVTGSLG